MIFRGMSETSFATFFVVAKQAEIKKELNINKLYLDMVVKVVSEFVVRNKQEIQSRFQNQYDALFDEEFLVNIINILKYEKSVGTPLEIKL